MSFLSYVVRSLGDTLDTLDRAIAHCDEPDAPVVRAADAPAATPDPGRPRHPADRPGSR